MLNLRYKGTASGLQSYIDRIKNCTSCFGKGSYYVPDCDCVSAEECDCMAVLKTEKQGLENCNIN